MEKRLLNCYMDTDIFIVYVIGRHLWNFTGDVDKRFNTSNYKVKRSLPISRNKKVVALMKDQLSGETMN